MIRSMTAFARRSLEKNANALTLEIHSLNHRYLDITFKLPETLRFLEPQLRERITQQMRRGKIECQLKHKIIHTPERGLLFNKDLLQAFAQAAQNTRTLFKQDLSISLTDLLAWPDMLQNSAHEDSALLQQDVLQLFDETLQELISVRQREGLALKAYLHTHLEELANEVENIKKHIPKLLKEYRKKILDRIDALKITVDPTRLEQELLFITNKSDVCEEIERLQLHMTEVRKTLETPDSVGRRLDFLMQELHREANTLGSKSLDGQVTHAVVNLKVWIEQMREQVQNIE